MDINLEKIELVKDRTGSTYAEAKEALEKADGSVVDAIIDIEERLNRAHDAVDGGSLKDSPIFAKMKEIVDKGNVTRILIRKGEKTVVNFPVTAGVVGAVLVPWGAIIGIVAALGTQCNIEFVAEDGNVIDINGKVIGAYDKARETISKATGEGSSFDDTMGKVEDAAYKFSDKIQDLGDKGASKVTEAWDKLEESGTVDDIKEAFTKGTARLMMMWDKLEKSGKIDEVKDAVESVARKAADTAKSIAKDAAERARSEEQADEIDDLSADLGAELQEEFKDEEI